MEIKVTNIEGVVVLKPDKYKDERGFFAEIYNEKKYLPEVINKQSVQVNYSHSKKNVLRGLHFQVQKPQAKIVQVLNGKIFDVGVDLRKKSTTFGQYFSIEMCDEDFTQIYFPPGIAHGFCVMSESADVMYHCTDFYDSNDENGIIWNDPDLKIKWPVAHPIISEKDQSFDLLSNLNVSNFPQL